MNKVNGVLDAVVVIMLDEKASFARRRQQWHLQNMVNKIFSRQCKTLKMGFVVLTSIGICAFSCLRLGSAWAES